MSEAVGPTLFNEWIALRFSHLPEESEDERRREAEELLQRSPIEHSLAPPDRRKG